MSSTETPQTTSAPATPERVYVEIPHAKPGQGYHAPKNYQQPLLDQLTRLAITAICAAIPLATALIFFMILAFSNAISEGLLWLWIVMILFIEPIAILVAIGIAREALGVSGSSR